MCEACKNGDHEFHAGGRLSFICIGCSCEWMPGDPEPSDHE